MNIQPIVEGDGEVRAVPVLLRRLRDVANAYPLEVNPPIKRPRADLVRETGVRKAVRLARPAVPIVPAHGECVWLACRRRRDRARSVASIGLDGSLTTLDQTNARLELQDLFRRPSTEIPVVLSEKFRYSTGASSTMPSLSPRAGIACLIVIGGIAACLAGDERRLKVPVARWRQHDVHRPKPPVVEPAESGVTAKPPKDAIILFDGTGLEAWKSHSGGPARWKVVEGALETVPGAGMIETRGTYGDIHLHVEWATPRPPVGVGQDRGNSGIFLMGQFEIQVLDSFKADTYADGQAGAIYGQYPPLFNASRPPGQWQVYEVAFRRPRFDSSGKLLEPARVTLFHNGILVQNNEEPVGPTSWLKWLPYEPGVDRGPIALQDHDHPVRFRNIWLCALPDRPAPTAANLTRPKTIALPPEILDRYAGQYVLNSQPDALKATIARDGNRLTLALPFRPGLLELEPISETQFDMPFTDGRFTFLKDDSGRVTGVHFRIGDGERHWKRVEP